MKGKAVIEVDFETTTNEGCNDPTDVQVRESIGQIFLQRALKTMDEQDSFVCMGYRLHIKDTTLDIKKAGNGAEF